MALSHTRIFFITIAFLFAACTGNEKVSTDNAAEEIRKAEKDFAAMAADKGIAEAFWFFADSGAVIKRQNDTLVKGKEQIKEYYCAPYFKTASVTWSPDFVAVAENGDLGYTYGNYTWQSKDSSGAVQEARGVFHTVWKKQKDGSWKYVWD